MKFNLKLWALLTILFVSLICFVNSNNAEATEFISGSLTTDTTWTKANSPYNLTGNLLVNYGVTLTVQPGVTVNFNGFYIMVNGTLDARGTKTDWIKFDGYDNYGDAIIFTEYSTNWNEQTNSGCIIEFVKIDYLEGIQIDGGSPKICNNIANATIGIIYGEPLIANNLIAGLGSGVIVVKGGSPSIINNTLKDRARSQPFVYYGIYLEHLNSAFIKGNIIDKFTHAGIAYGVTGSGAVPTIENNNITNCPIGIDLDGSPAIVRNNTISSNTIGIQDPQPESTIAYNNFANTQYDFKLTKVTGDVNAFNNWWGTTNSTLISQKIWDYNDAFTVGTVNFEPYLNELNVGAWGVGTDLPVAPTPTPTPATTATTTPTPTLTESPPTTSPIDQSPTPSVPEFDNPIIIVTAMTATAVALTLTVAKKPKNNNQ